MKVQVAGRLSGTVLELGPGVEIRIGNQVFVPQGEVKVSGRSRFRGGKAVGGTLILELRVQEQE